MFSRQVAIRLFAVAVVTALSWSAWAACADAAALTQAAQMACCKDGELSCAPNGNARDCCSTGATRSQDAVSNAPMKPLHHWTAIAVVSTVLPTVLTFDSARVRARESASPPQIAPGPPPYIAFSSLLI